MSGWMSEFYFKADDISSGLLIPGYPEIIEYFYRFDFWFALIFLLFFICALLLIRKHGFKGFLEIGISNQLQRIGLLILVAGLISFFAWVMSDGFIKFDVYVYGDNRAGGANFIRLPAYHFPSHHDSFFCRTFVWVIPTGLFLTWLYPIWKPIALWVSGGK